MRKILFLFSNFHQREFTGQSGTIWEVVKSLSGDFKVAVLSNDETGTESLIDNIFVSAFKSKGDQTLQYFSKIPFFLGKIKEFSPDIVHVHGLPFIVFSALICTLSRKPFSCSFNEDITLRPKWLQQLIAFSINRSERVFVSCRYFRDYLVKLGVRSEKISFSPFGLKEKFINYSSTLTEDIDIVYVGDARKSRGFDVVVDMALAMVDKKFLVLIRWISDSGKLDMEKLIKMPNVEILHYPYSRPLTELIQRAKIVLLPFRATSPILPPMTVAEAMALGKCVLTTALPGMEELCEDGKSVYVINVENVSSAVNLAEKILNNSDERVKMEVSARQKVNAIFLEQFSQFKTFFSHAIGN